MTLVGGMSIGIPWLNYDHCFKFFTSLIAFVFHQSLYIVHVQRFFYIVDYFIREQKLTSTTSLEETHFFGLK
jgi:hypothetical protein